MKVLSTLLGPLDDVQNGDTSIIPWSCPVPSFGDSARAQVATLGLNPSNREFLDDAGNELAGPLRRFHTLRSLGLERWADANSSDLEEISTSCKRYFFNNPYDRWFKRLDFLLTDTGTSYYSDASAACHLDLIPYATHTKWMALRPDQRNCLFNLAGSSLGVLLRDSPVRLLVLNGRSVVDQFELQIGFRLAKTPMTDWCLPRQTLGVPGFSYHGHVSAVSGVDLGRELTVIGYNHNIQSSYGVTTAVVENIRDWIGRAAAVLL